MRVCICVWDPGRWPSLAEHLSEDGCEYRGLLLLEDQPLCSLHLKGNTELHRAPPLLGVRWQHTHPPAQWAPLPGDHRGVQLFTLHITGRAKRKNTTGSEGGCERRKSHNRCTDEENIKALTQEIIQRDSQFANHTLKVFVSLSFCLWRKWCICIHHEITIAYYVHLVIWLKRWNHDWMLFNLTEIILYWYSKSYTPLFRVDLCLHVKSKLELNWQRPWK